MVVMSEHTIIKPSGPIRRTLKPLKGMPTERAILEKKFNRICRLANLDPVDFLMRVEQGKTIEFVTDKNKSESFTPSQREREFATRCFRPTVHHRDQQNQEKREAAKRIEKKLSSLGCLVEIPRPSSSETTNANANDDEDEDEPFAHLGIYKLPRASM